MNSLIRELAENAPKELVDEVRASHDMTVEEAAHHSCKGCLEGFVIQFNDKVAGITGLTSSPLCDVGVPWLLTTHSAFQERRAFLVLSKALVVRWSQTYRILENYTDIRYRAALRWARHVGFEFQEVVPFGPFSMPFQKIVYRRQ